MMGRVLCLLALLCLVPGCGKELPQPEAAPLAASAQALQELYKWGPGPYQLAVAPELAIPRLEVAAEKAESELRFNVYYPLDAQQLGGARSWNEDSANWKPSHNRTPSL